MRNGGDEGMEEYQAPVLGILDLYLYYIVFPFKVPLSYHAYTRTYPHSVAHHAQCIHMPYLAMLYQYQVIHACIVP